MKVLYTCVHDLYKKNELEQICFIVKEEIDLKLFPKYCKVYNQRCSMGGNKPDEVHTSIIAYFNSDEVNKGKNESGMKRLERYLKVMKAIFPNAEYQQMQWGNNMALPQNLLSIING